MQEMQNKTWMRRSVNMKQYVRGWLLVSGALIAVILATLVGFTVVKQRALDDLQAYEFELKKEAAELDNLLNQKKLLDSEQQSCLVRLTKMRKLGDSTKSNPHRYLQKIAQIIPKRVVLTAFSFDKKIRLEGCADTIQQVTQFMRLLAQTKLFAMPQIVSVSRNKKHDDDQAVVGIVGAGKISFVIEALKA